MQRLPACAVILAGEAAGPAQMSVQAGARAACRFFWNWV